MPTEPVPAGSRWCGKSECALRGFGENRKTVADVRRDVGHVVSGARVSEARKAQDMEKYNYKNTETWSDADWEKRLRAAGCFAAALSCASARFYLHHRPPGTKWAYWNAPELVHAAEQEEGVSDRHVRLRLAEFRRTPIGRATYDAAPADAQRFYRREAGDGNPLDSRLIYDLYRTMDDASWDYLLAHAWTPAQRADLADIRAHMQGRPSGTQMFWWKT